MTRQRIFYFCGTLVLLFWGAVLTYFYHSGRLGDYVVLGKFSLGVLLGGYGLMALGAFNLSAFLADVFRGRNPLGEDDAGCCGNTGGCAGEHEHEHEHGHEHAHAGEGEQEHAHDHTHFAGEESVFGGIVSLAVLVLPLSFALATASDDPSANAVEQMGVFLSSDDLFSKGEAEMMFRNQQKFQDVMPSEEEEFSVEEMRNAIDKTPEGNLAVQVTDLFFSAGDELLQQLFTQDKIEIVAQYMPEKVNNPNGTRIRIFRLYMQCCAADMRPIPVTVELGRQPPELEKMSWVRVTGIMRYPVEDGVKVPVLMAESLKPAEKPKDAILSL